MNEGSQLEIPPSFVALYTDPRRQRLREPIALVAERYELCEDLAHRLIAQAQNLLHSSLPSEDEILHRCHDGLLVPDSVVTPEEAGWVVLRLAELLAWPFPELAHKAPPA